MIADKLSRRISAGVQSLVLQMGPSSCRPVCNPVQSQTPQVCFTGTGSDSLGLCFPSNLPAHQGDLQVDGSRLLQSDSNCSRVAQHALVLGPGQSIGSDSIQASTAGESGDTALQRSPSQEPRQSESTCSALRASVIQEQGFSDRNMGSLTKWEQELRLLRANQSSLQVKVGHFCQMV